MPYTNVCLSVTKIFLIKYFPISKIRNKSKNIEKKCFTLECNYKSTFYHNQKFLNYLNMTNIKRPFSYNITIEGITF